MNKQLQNQIIVMVAKDQNMRSSDNWDPKIDRQNTKTLKNLIKKYGWPDIPLVGKKASQGAFLLVQHADKDLKFQKLCLKLITQKVKERKVDPQNLAYLTDRVLVNLGKPQLYGTQFHLNKSKKLVPRPIKDKKGLIKRRIKFKLEPFSEYKKKLQSRQNNITKIKG